MIGDFSDGLSGVRAGPFLLVSLGRSYFGGTSSLSIRASDFKGSVCTCASYTRPQLVHLSVRYSNPARIWTTLWTVGQARHLADAQAQRVLTSARR